MQARAQTIRGTWHLVATAGIPAYVVFAGDQVRQLVFTAIVTDNPGAEGQPAPQFQAAPAR